MRGSAGNGSKSHRILFGKRIKEDGNDLLQLFCQSKWYDVCYFISYCLFNCFVYIDIQKWIGFADVKSAPVHFYVQRNSSSRNSEKTPIPFDLARVNEGKAMDLTSGIFTAPRPGIYFFSFTGSARLKSSSSVHFYSRLYFNGKRIGASNVQENNGPVDQYSQITVQSTLNLKTGDQLWVQIDGNSSSYLLDNGNHLTHFTGFMLEEEIVASL
jgi:hypothetical protein